MPKKPKQVKITGGKPVICPTGKPCIACDDIVTIVRPIR